ncbi:MAG: Ig-like domain-containing protein [Thermoanaerobaculia bacterium]
MRARSPLLLLGLCAAAVFAGCSEGTVAAPEGGSILLDANPPVIGLGEVSEITALVRDGNGNPVRGDVEVLFFTNLGEIDRAARTNSQGLATATLTAGSTAGTATVRAVAGPNEATIDVQIGTRVGTITLQASPAGIPNTGGTSQLVAVVRDSNGEAIEGAPVTFSTELGTLDSGGGVVETNERGEARDRVEVSASEAGSWPDPAFTVRATTPGPEGDTLEATFDIAIQTLAPRAAFTAVSAGGNMVRFTNQSTGQEPLSFAWDFTNDGTTDSMEREPVHDYGAAGNFTVKLTVSNAHGDNMVTEQITVPVPP